VINHAHLVWESGPVSTPFTVLQFVVHVLVLLWHALPTSTLWNVRSQALNYATLIIKFEVQIFVHDLHIFTGRRCAFIESA
jgi:hypothetical protein